MGASHTHTSKLCSCIPVLQVTVDVLRQLRALGAATYISVSSWWCG